MSAPRLLQAEAPAVGPPAPPLREVIACVREADEGVRRVLEAAPAGARPYLVAAERYLLLAVSSLSIAQLAEGDPELLAVDRIVHRPRGPDG